MGLDRGLRVTRIYERVRPRRVKGFGEKRTARDRQPTPNNKRLGETSLFRFGSFPILTNVNDTATGCSKRGRANGEDFIGVRLMAAF